MASDASHTLEDALERMDYIIAGSKLSEAGRLCLPLMDPTLTPALPPAVDPGFRVLQLAEGLRAALEGQGTPEDQEYLWSQVSISMAHSLLQWLQGEVNRRSPGNTETYQERLARLEGDKESLVLQVSVLTDQVEAQGAKISDLESSLEEHQHKLNTTEEMLQQELVNRASLESQKENLMGEVSYLKVKLGDMEEKHNHGLDRHHKAESVVNLISELQEQMCRFQQEINSRIQEKKALENQAESITQDTIHTDSMDVLSPDLGLACNSTPEEGLLQELRVLRDKVGHLEDQKSQYERKLKVTKAEISDLQRVLLSKNAEIETLHSQLLARPTAPTDSSDREEMYRRRLNNKYEELHRLRKGMDSLLAANDEKDRRIEELTLLLSQCRQFREGVPSTRQAPPAVRSLSNGRTASSSSEEEEQAPGTKSDSASAVSEDVKSEISSDSSSLQFVSRLSPPKNTESRTQPLLLSSSMEDLQNGHAQKLVVGSLLEAAVVSPESPKTDCRSQTLPVMASLPAPIRDRDSSSDTQSQRSPEDSEDGDSTQRKTEKPDETTSSSERSPTSSGLSQESGHRLVGSPEHLKNNRSIRKLWGKLRRTQSGGLQALEADTSQFRRGGLRATAGPRLTRTPESGSSARDLNIPFGQWTREQVCGWLEDFGLGQYVNLTRHWVDNGQTLLSATPQDLEKEMGMKHPLHRKKLQLALKAFANKVTEKSTELDHIWVTRWLDDIGLPQYKDQFHEARVDGRMIQYLTVNDLLSLKVTSQLHHLSVKCAIHVLHANRFNPHCLRRRPGEEKQPSPSEVVQWSNHRVMEWLRAVDLAEYAPNLRGSGVHGGLIILEPRFSSETLALLLNIPPQKTLLRRHLATAFATLVGIMATQEKREYANATGHVPLTTTAKVRPKKLGFTHFSHLRKRRPDESADYICPIDSGDLSTLKGASPRPYAALRGLTPILDREPERQQQVGTKS